MVRYLPLTSTVAAAIGADVPSSTTCPESGIAGPSGTRKMVCVWLLASGAPALKYSGAETSTKTLDCCISVKLKLPDASVVADLPASLPLVTVTVASEMGTLVLLVMTCPLRVNVVRADAAGDGAAGDDGSFSLPLQASIGTRSSGMANRVNISPEPSHGDIDVVTMKDWLVVERSGMYTLTSTCVPVVTLTEAGFPSYPGQQVESHTSTSKGG